jgi:hypothetical protein
MNGLPPQERLCTQIEVWGEILEVSEGVGGGGGGGGAKEMGRAENNFNCRYN